MNPTPEATGRLAAVRAFAQNRPALVSGSELIAGFLAAQGFRWIAGVSGTPVHDIFRACAQRGLRVLGTRSQAGATLMTGAAAFVAGQQTGAVVLSAGPAVTNAITGILVARDNGWPLLVLGGCRAVRGGLRGQFQQLDAATLIAPIVKWAGTAHRAAEIPALLREAVREARSCRPGPVYLDLPEDVLQERCVDPGPGDPITPTWIEPAAEDVARLAQQLRTARRPVIVLGDGVRWRLDLEQVQPWLTALPLPIIPLPLLRGVVAESHPWAVTDVRGRSQVLSEADLVPLLGADLDWRLRFGAEIGGRAMVVQVGDCPEPPERWGRRFTSIAADPGLFLNRLREVLPPDGLATGAALPERAHPRRSSHSPAAPAERLSIRALFETIRAALPPEAFLVLDGNITLEAGLRWLAREHPLLQLDPGWNGCMGSGIPFAMAARLHHPSRPVLLVTGDFGFGLGCIELETSVRHQLPIVVVVVNNDGATGGFTQQQALPPSHGERVHAFQPALPYELLAQGLGMEACRASQATELAGALSHGFQSGRSLLIHTLVDPLSTWSDAP